MEWIAEWKREGPEGNRFSTILRLERENEEMRGDIQDLLSWIKAEREKEVWDKNEESEGS
jgi:hypothetical protein